MAKILTGSTLSYGSVLPDPLKTADGSMFFLTAAYADPIASPTNPTGVVQNRSPGLHIYSFQQDANPSVIGDQVGQQWKQVSTLKTYVETTGDTMTGPLAITAQGAPGIRLISSTPGIRFTETDQGVNAKEWLLVADGGAFQVQTRDDTYSTSATIFSITRSGVGTLNSQVIWTAGNDGAGSGLDADLLDGSDGSFYLNSVNHTGVIPLSRGGTGVTTTVAGGIVFGGSGQLVTSVAGIAGQLLQSGGAGSPTWTNSSAIAVGSASQLTTARTIALSGAVTGSAAFDGTSNITIATTGGAVPWSLISGLPSAQQVFASTPSAGYSIRAGASLFYDFGNTGLSSLTPPQFVPGTISGFDGYSTSDIGAYQVGLTVIGVSAGGGRSMQLAANWNFEETAPVGGLRYRVNDDTTNAAAWGAFSTLWDSGNFQPGSYVAKAGDSMTGQLNVNGINLIYSTNSINVPGSGTFGSINVSSAGTFGSVSAGSITSTGNLTFNNVNVGLRFAANSDTGAIYLRANGVDSTQLVFEMGDNGSFAPDGFVWRGDGPSVTQDIMSLNPGGLYVTGDVVAYASDARLKKNVVVIQNAMDKIGTLGGYSYDWDMEKTRRLGFTPHNEHEHGLLAQEVQKVLPDAVCAAPFNADYLTVKYERLIALLVAGMNEQQAQINSLISEVEDLKNQR